MAKEKTSDKEVKYGYPEILVRFRNVKPNIKKQIGVIAKKLGYDTTNDFLKVELSQIRDKYGKQFPEIYNIKE